MRLFAPVTIHFDEAILIATAGLIVNVVTAWLLGGGGDHHAHTHGHSHGDLAGTPRMRMMKLAASIRPDVLLLEVFEDGVPPRFRLRHENKLELAPVLARARHDRNRTSGGARQTFRFVDREAFLESVEEIPEPHAFKAACASRT